MESVSGVGVLDKAVTVLQAVVGSPASLAELVSRTGLPRATVHRLGAALELHGLLRRDGAGRYELGLGLVSLGQAAAERFPLVELARPVLEELRTDTGESVQLFVREGAAAALRRVARVAARSAVDRPPGVGAAARRRIGGTGAVG